MRQFLFISLWLWAFMATAQASEAYIGQFLYKYDDGNIYRVTANDAKSMSWLCVEGSEKGANGIENPERFKVADKIYFVSWVEKTGIHVSQVINLKSMKVYSTIIDGKERYVLVGKVIREK
jgi:phenolic acid decarboxylase